MFMPAGEIMNQGGASRRLINLASVLVGRFRGGPAYIAIVSRMFFACISGSGPADVAAIGTAMIPQMVRHGYHLGCSAVCVGAAGTLGILIPPSIPAVISGIVTSTSIGKLFAAGLLPGILTGLVLMVTSYFIFARKAPLDALDATPGGADCSDATGQSKAGARERGFLPRLMGAIYEAKYAMGMPVLILGGIYTGRLHSASPRAVTIRMASVADLNCET
jgi:C4-dicarboxylate transporter DctM subunit